MKHSDYESAALYYDQLIADFPKSPFLQKAQHAAIDARMKAYLGPDYDTSGLEKARVLVRKTMDAFPERQASFEGLYHTLDVINDAEAEKTFRNGAYYKKIGKVASAEFYFGKIPQRWPNSPWAVKAKSELASSPRCHGHRPNRARSSSSRAAPIRTTAPAQWVAWAAWAWAGHGHGWHGRHGWHGWNDVKSSR